MFNAGRRGKRTKDGAGIISVGAHFNQQEFLIPTITGYSVTGDSDYEADDLALDTAGGQTITVNGSGFKSGAQVRLDNSVIGSVSVTPTAISFTAPAKTAGTYTLYVTNPNGGTAVLTPGVLYSGDPTWVSPAAGAELGPYYETISYLDSFEATNPQDAGSPIVYSLYDGEFPAGATLDSNAGTLSGTAPVDGGSTTYSFTIKATDSDLQDTLRSFTLTVNTDVVTWSAPDTSQSLFVDEAMTPLTLSASSAAGYGVSYAADSLPTGLTLANDSISGTPTVVGSQYTTLTATAATTSRTATRTITWSIQVGTDQYIQDVTLLMQGNGTSFTQDISTNAITVTPYGDPRSSTLSPHKENYYSMYYGGSTDYTRVNDSVNYADRDLGTGDFTIETWFYIDGRTAGQVLIDYRPTSTNGDYLMLAAEPDAGDGVFIFWQNTRQLGTGANTITADKWYHVAAVRESGVFTIYLNGVATGGTLSNSTNFVCPALRPAFGTSGYSASSSELLGYLKDTRIVKGFAVYTENFTPPTEPLTTTSQGVTASQVSILTNQSNGIVDNSPNAWPMHNNDTLTVVSEFIPFEMPDRFADLGSVYLDGSGAYLRADDALADIGTTDEFTIECWVFATVISEYLFGLNTKANGGNEYIIPLGSSTLYLQGSARSSGGLSSATAPLVGGWWHFAWVYSYTGSQWNTNIYINGESAYELANVQYDVALSDCVFGIGAEFDGANGGSPGNYITGYVADVRVTKEALYTSTFTPSTSPLTATNANCKLLTLTSNRRTEVNNKAFDIDGGAALPGTSTAYDFTNNGSVVSRGVTPYSPYGFSAYFDGTGDYLSAPNNAGFQFGTGDFTVECWINKPAAVNGSVVDVRSGGTGAVPWAFYVDASNFPYFYDGTVYTSTVAIVNNTWNHIAVTRFSGVLKIFVNGVQGYSASHSVSLNATGNLLIGGTAAYTTGYISNLRIVKGTALYTSNFIPSTTALTPTDETTLLTCQSPSFVDNSATRAALTGYGDVRVTPYTPFKSNTITPDSHSMYFDGDQDFARLTQSSTTPWSLGGSGDFTIECWFYIKATSAPSVLFDFRPASSQGQYPLLQIPTNRASVDYILSNSNAITGTVSGGLQLNTWYHVALVRNSGTTKLYVDGTQVGSDYTDTNTYSSISRCTLGISGFDDQYYDLNGYISNLRFVHDAVYTSSFTPPTSPLTAISNTVLLTAQSNTLKDNSGSGYTPTVLTSGSSQPTEFNPFGFTTSDAPVAYDPSIHGGSGYFATTSDYITYAPGNTASFGTGDFTVECWVYPQNSDLDISMPSVTTSTWSLLTYANQLYWKESGSNLGGAGYGTVTQNAWNHLAVCRASGTLRMFINGVQVYSAANSFNYSGTGTTRSIGPNGGGGAPYYVSDFKIHNQTALYSGAFVPPKRVGRTPTESLILNFDNLSFYDSKANIILSKGGSGGTTGLSSVKKFGTGSIFFDGANDEYLVSDTHPELKIGTQDFTIEFWVNFTDTSNRQDILWIGTTSTRLGILWNLTSGQLTYYPATSAISAAVSFSTGTWYHVALARSSGSTKLFVDGTQIGSTYSDSKNLDGTILYLGKDSGTGGAAAEFKGYLDDLRITIGTARYTADFTPPIQELISR